jgi:hypothetical protein
MTTAPYHANHVSTSVSGDDSLPLFKASEQTGGQSNFVALWSTRRVVVVSPPPLSSGVRSHALTAHPPNYFDRNR